MRSIIFFSNTLNCFGFVGFSDTLVSELSNPLTLILTLALVLPVVPSPASDGAGREVELLFAVAAFILFWSDELGESEFSPERAEREAEVYDDA